MEDDCWGLVCLPDEGSFHDVFGDGDEFFVLGVQGVDLIHDLFVVVGGLLGFEGGGGICLVVVLHDINIKKYYLFYGGPVGW